MSNSPTTHRIIVPVDSVRDRAVAVSVAQDLGRRLNAEVEAITVMEIDEPEAERGKLSRQTTTIDDTLSHRFITSDSVETALLRVAEPADVLLCIASSGRTAIVESLTGSLSASLLNHSARPVLVVGPHCQPALRGTQLAIAVDGTPEGELIIDAALDLAAALQLTPVLYQVLPEGTNAVVGGARESSYVGLVALQRSRPGRTVQFDVLHDKHVAQALSRLAQDQDIAMVAMSSLGLAPFERLMLPSIAHQVLRHAHCPLLIGARHVASAPFHHGTGRRVVVGVDGSRADSGAIKVAVEEAQRRDASIEIVHSWAPTWYYTEIGAMAAEDDKPIRDQAEHVLNEAVAQVRQLAPDIEVIRWMPERMPIDALLEAAIDAEVLVVAEHHYSAFERWMQASTTEALVHRSPVPIMVVPEWAQLEAEPMVPTN
jgi:nucleotide-binding universal stress UspA family protein